jgi:signal transduction histidine kinase
LRTGEANLATGNPTCDVLDLIRELTSASRLTLPGGCNLRVTVAANLPACFVRIERAVLTQVLTNLLVNAVESLPPDRGEVEICIQPAATDWLINVSDNGCGIPERYMREDLFHPFRSTKDGGMGVGLYHCKVLVEAAGGGISVRSKEGVGTAVTLKLAAAPAAGDDRENKGVRHAETDAARSG